MSNPTNLMTGRELLFLVHLTIGVAWIHAFAGGIATLVGSRASRLKEVVRIGSTVSLSVVAWAAVITGTYLVYPGYRAKPPEGAENLAYYPKEALLADHNTAFWHDFGMEWKEHIGWLTPFLATAIAFIVIRYGRRVTTDPPVRRAMAGLFTVAAGGALVASGLGAAINAIAPNEFLDIG